MSVRLAQALPLVPINLLRQLMLAASAGANVLASSAVFSLNVRAR